MTPTQTMTLDLGRKASAPGRLYLGQGDHDGTVLVASITDCGRPFDCTGFTPYLVMPTGVRYEGECSGSVATIPIDESLLGDFSGTLWGAYVSLVGELITSTQRFDVTVHPCPPPPTDDQPDDDPQGGDDPQGESSPADDPQDGGDPAGPGDDPADERPVQDGQ